MENRKTNDRTDVAGKMKNSLLSHTQHRLNLIRTLCLRHNSPAVVTSTHQLASTILKIIDLEQDFLDSDE